MGIALTRPIMLLAILYKFIIRVWLGLSKAWIAPRENWTTGFRAGYQASHMTRTVMGLIKQAQEWRSELHAIKTDLRKTYDRVPLAGILHAMQARNLPRRILAYLWGVLNRQVQFEAPGIGATEPVQLDHGLPQGCPASPLLFSTLLLQVILQPLVQKWKDEGRGIVVDGDVVCILALADDLDLFDQSHSGIQDMLAELSVVLRAAGQTLQAEKCAWMPVGGGSHEGGVTVDGRALPRFTGHTILGTRVTLKNRAREAVTHRFERVWAAWWTNKPLFCHRAKEPPRRLTFFTNVFGASALRGLEAVPLRRSDTRLLDVVCLHT